MRGMDNGQAEELAHQLRALAPAAHPALRAACKVIQVGDEHALTTAEAETMRGALPKVLRASGAARVAARALLRAHGLPDADLPRTASGAPHWPAGFIGSLAHDESVAVAVVAQRDACAGVGIDVEPPLPLPPDLIDRIATPAERIWLHGDAMAARLLFCIKEAVYKASHPLDGRFLDHHDVEVAADLSSARTVSGRTLRVHASRGVRLLAIALAARANGG